MVGGHLVLLVVPLLMVVMTFLCPAMLGLLVILHV